MGDAPAEPRIRARRELTLTLALLAAGAVLGLLAASRPWGTVLDPAPVVPAEVTFTGSDLVPILPASSLVALAALVAVLAVRGFGRRLVGALVALVGAAAALSAGPVAADLEDRLEQRVLNAPDVTASAATVVSSSPTLGVLAVTGSVVVMVAGALVAVRGPSWPGMGTRYERGPSSPATTSTADGDAATSRERWDALDRGDDPTG